MVQWGGRTRKYRTVGCCEIVGHTYKESKLIDHFAMYNKSDHQQSIKCDHRHSLQQWHNVRGAIKRRKEEPLRFGDRCPDGASLQRCRALRHVSGGSVVHYALPSARGPVNALAEARAPTCLGRSYYLSIINDLSLAGVLMAPRRKAQPCMKPPRFDVEGNSCPLHRSQTRISLPPSLLLLYAFFFFIGNSSAWFNLRKRLSWPSIGIGRKARRLTEEKSGAKSVSTLCTQASHI